MQYTGGKQKSGGAQIAKLINAMIGGRELRVYLEPFCGALSVLQRVHATTRVAADACQALITFHQAVQDGWVPPDAMTREQWEGYKANPDPEDPMTALAGFGCSRGGAWFASYVDKYKFTKRVVHPAFAASQSARKKMAKCQDVRFVYRDYRRSPKADVVYCDPPYANTLGYPAVGEFDHEEFWSWATERSKTDLLVVSEMAAPDNFVAVLRFDIQSRIATKSGGRRTEFLFAHVDQAATWEEYL